MKRSSMPARTKPMSRTSLRVTRDVDQLIVKLPKRMKSKQRAVTAEEHELWHRMAGLGCIACLMDGRENPFVSMHHISGRTAPGCHKKVLPLCAGHHQDGTGNDKSLVAVHPFKKRFENLYGRQIDLLDEVMGRLK
jgi:hypothetical protein